MGDRGKGKGVEKRGRKKAEERVRREKGRVRGDEEWYRKDSGAITFLVIGVGQGRGRKGMVEDGWGGRERRSIKRNPPFSLFYRILI